MTVAWKLRAQQFNIVDTSNIENCWHALCMVYCCAKSSNTNIQQAGFAQIALTLRGLIAMLKQFKFTH